MLVHTSRMVFSLHVSVKDIIRTAKGLDLVDCLVTCLAGGTVESDWSKAFIPMMLTTAPKTPA